MRVDASPTPADFGAQGEWPSHPDLLDWLAVEFIESGWDVKHLIKLVVTSDTYRQSSAATPAHFRIVRRLNADVFNLPNLLDRDWGLVRETTNREGAVLMSVTGWDAAANRSTYTVARPARNRVVPDASRWRIQLGVRWKS